MQEKSCCWEIASQKFDSLLEGIDSVNSRKLGLGIFQICLHLGIRGEEIAIHILDCCWEHTTVCWFWGWLRFRLGLWIAIVFIFPMDVIDLNNAVLRNVVSVISNITFISARLLAFFPIRTLTKIYGLCYLLSLCLC